MANTTELKTAYADWLLTYNWAYFFTSTFRKPRSSPYYALQAVWKWLFIHHEVKRAFLVSEPFKTGDLHVHGLLAGARNQGVYVSPRIPSIDLPSGIWSGLYNAFGRNKVEGIKSGQDVANYCSKYILKEDGAFDCYEIFGEWKK